MRCTAVHENKGPSGGLSFAFSAEVCRCEVHLFVATPCPGWTVRELPSLTPLGQRCFRKGGVLL